MPRRSATILAVTLAIASPAPSRAAEPGEDGERTIHLEGAQGSGYTRPHLDNQACLAEALEAQPATAGFDARVRFMVERDGRLSAFSISPEASPAAEQAVRAAFESCPWSPGLDPEGKALVVRVTQPVRVAGRTARQDAERVVAPGLPPPPVDLGGGHLRLDDASAAGYQRPAPADPACLRVGLQRRKAAAGLDNTVKFAVMRDGSLGHFTFNAPVAREVEEAVAAAFRACPWRPARDPSGEPLAVWVVQPLKVAPLPPEKPALRPLFE